MYMQMGGWSLTTGGAKVPVYMVDYFYLQHQENNNYSYWYTTVFKLSHEEKMNKSKTSIMMLSRETGLT